MEESVQPVRLLPETLKAFLDYAQRAEDSMAQTLQSDMFLWSQADPKRSRRLGRGDVIAELWNGAAPLRVQAGLIHDWIGAVSIPDATLADTLARIQDYDHHKDFYRPEVVDSRLLSRHGNDFRIYLRILKKKVLTVVLDTDHDVTYQQVSASRWACASHTTRTAEVDDPGTSRERIHPPDTGYGFLWRLNSYWRFEESPAGVIAECRAISLTRDIPAALKWIIQPIVRSLPKDTLIHTLKCTRDAVKASQK